MSTAPALDTAQQLAFTLRRELDGEVRFDPGSRHLYATDASNYRHVPLGVVLPRHAGDVATTLAHCRQAGVPVTSRGAGTSLAGQATGPGVVLDTSRHLDRILEVEAHARTATVEPGVVLDRLQAEAAPHGLMFGPDPSTHDRCTIGGMIGNDACGVHSLTTGRTMHNVEALDVVLADGTHLEVGRHDLGEARALARRDDRMGRLFAGLLDLRSRVGPLVEARVPTIPRRVSGYHLDQLLGEDHLHVARSLVGTEGTCAVILGARVRLLDRPHHRAVVVIAHPDLAAAADHVPTLLAHDLLGLEGIDDTLVAGASRPGRAASSGVALLPPGRAWLLAEVGADTPGAARAAAEALAAAIGGEVAGDAVRVVDDPDAQRALWRVRADGLGAVTFVPGQRPKLAGWEDAAVAPEHLGAYLRRLGGLLDEHGLSAGVYGHFGDGCVHTKIDFDHTTDAGRTTFRRFVEDAADLVVSLGGSLSGEHGDGQARGELLERMYGPELVAAFGAFKHLWDPHGLLNPGRVVDARPLDADLRLADRAAMTTPTGWFALPDGDDLAGAAARCVGVGRCRRDEGTGTMCPSWMATHEEAHSTRGRAHLLFELLHPDTELDGWQDEAVADALELCLSCKACKAECPVDVDLATYKAEFLAHRYEGRRRPREHYALGLARWWLRLGSRTPRLTNAVLGSRAGRLGARAAGIAAQRPVPALAAVPFSRWWRRRSPPRGPAPAGRVLLFVDTFTETLQPEVGHAAVRVLEAAGHRVEVAGRPVCCGRPLYDHGMLDTARRQLTRLARTLGPAARAGIPVVGLEPSCVAALRDELPAMLPDDEDARAVAGAARTLAEQLVAGGWRPPRLDTEVVVHTHCHQDAVLGSEADCGLLAAAGVGWEELDAGCCGLAGSFGLRAGEPYEVSVAAGEDRFAPRVRAAAERGATVVADGYSCRTQAAHLLGGPAPTRHLAQVLADALDDR